MSKLRVPRSLSRIRPPVERKNIQLSLGLSLLISCLVLGRSLCRTAFWNQRVRGVVRAVGVVTTAFIQRVSWGGGEDVVAIVVEMDCLCF